MLWHFTHFDATNSSLASAASAALGPPAITPSNGSHTILDARIFIVLTPRFPGTASLRLAWGRR
jgi:hypothetical protein